MGLTIARAGGAGEVRPRRQPHDFCKACALVCPALCLADTASQKSLSESEGPVLGTACVRSLRIERLPSTRDSMRKVADAAPVPSLKEDQVPAWSRFYSVPR